ncbi:MAG: LTA synthase family protein [Chloroflexi bacterium]|nr:LTA synthase family protein [Chloroflexota bacterium]
MPIAPFVETKNWLILWLIIMSLLIGYLTYRILKSRAGYKKLTEPLNIFSVIFTVIIVFNGIRQNNTQKLQNQDPGYLSSTPAEAWNKTISSEASALRNTGALPDIYYIVLDGYGRQDVLASIYGADTSQFLSFLTKQGFYLATDGRANYAHTQLSLSSSLNLMYLNDVASQYGVENNAEIFLSDIFNHNRVFHQLRSLGYRIASFSTDFDLASVSTSDIVFSPGLSPNNFQNLVLNNTPLTIFLPSQQYDWHRNQILYTLDHLPDVAASDQPTFVFAHIFAPHPPFVFGVNGEAIYPPREYQYNDGSDFMEVASREEYVTGYRDQVEFLSRKLISTISKILAASKTPPVIIIQGDHGPGSMFDQNSLENTNVWERFSILNAYYLPSCKQTVPLYPGISPANTFRLVFDDCFGAGYPLLDDRSYYSPLDNQFDLADVTDKITEHPLK